MDKLDRSSSASAHVREDEGAAEVARVVERDFRDLLALFDRQLASLAEGDASAREHLLGARAAAEQGLELSRQLIARLEA